MNSDTTETQKRIYRISLWVRAIAWTAFSIFLLLRTSNSSTGNSERILELRWYSRWSVFESVGHAILFAILTRLWIRTLANHVPRSYALWLPVSFAFLLGVSTEIIQYFMATRGASILDLAANLIGILLAVVSLRTFLNLKE
jgi:VanZ family protein